MIELSLWSLPSAFSSFVGLALLVWSLQTAQTVTGKVLTYLMSAMVIWTSMHFLRTLGTTVEQKLLPHVLLLPSAIAVAYYYAVFGIVHITKRVPSGAFMMVPVVAGLILVSIALIPATRPIIFTELSIRNVGGFSALSIQTSDLFNLFYIPPVLLMLTGVAALFLHAYRVPLRRTRSTLYALVGLLVLLSHQFMRQMWVDDITPVNFAPVSWGLIMALFTLVVMRYERQVQGLSYPALLENLPDSLILVDTEQRIVYFNKEAQRRVRLPESEILHQIAADVFGINPIIIGETTERDLESTHAGATYRDDITISILKRSSGEPMIYACVIEDRTSVYEQLDRLKEVHDQLLLQSGEQESANEAKRKFLASTSREMQTPIREIMTLGDRLESQLAKRSTTTESLGFVQDVKGAAKHLLSVVDHIAYYEQTGKETDLQRSWVEFADVLDEVRRQFEPQARAKDLNLVVACSVQQEIFLDRQRIKQVLINLVSNAIKFTPPGGEVSMTAVTDHTQLVLQVIDTGIGIDFEDQDRIFAPFEQVDSSLSRTVGGTGLGLPMARRLARAHGGDIQVHANEPHGSTFTLVIPLSDKEEFQPMAPPALT